MFNYTFFGFQGFHRLIEIYIKDKFIKNTNVITIIIKFMIPESKYIFKNICYFSLDKNHKSIKYWLTGMHKIKKIYNEKFQFLSSTQESWYSMCINWVEICWGNVLLFDYKKYFTLFITKGHNSYNFLHRKCVLLTQLNYCPYIACV